MMKYINILALFICSVFFLSSCESEEKLINEGEIKLILSPVTKSTQSGAFDVGDDVGVFAVERTNDNQVGSLNSPKYVNVQYRFNGTSFDAVGTKIQYSGKKYDFYVYSPYNSAYNNINQIVHSASTNQVNGSGWLDADFCSAINTTGIETGNVPLSFDHKFATVQLKVDNDVSAVSLLQVQTSGSFSFSSNSATAGGSKSDITMYKESAGSFLVTFPVQTLSGTIFKITKANSKTVDFKLPASKNLQPGVNVIYTIDLKATVKVNQAANGTATGGGEYEVGEECTVKATPDNGYVFAGWYENGNKVSSDRNYTFTVSGDRELTPVFQSETPVETWNYTFVVTNWKINTGWQAGSGNVLIVSMKQKYLNGVPSGSAVNVGYSLQSCPSWINASGNSTFLSWEANNFSSSRSGKVYWRQDESAKTGYAQVDQSGKPADVITTQESWEITVDPPSHTFASSGGSKTFTVKLYKVTKTYTNGVLTNTSRVSHTGWSSYVSGTGFSRSGDTVTASANPNTTGRSGTFTASYQGVSASASLYQSGKPADVITTQESWEITVDPPSHTFASSGGSKTFTVKLYKVTKTYTNGVLTNTSRVSHTGWSSSASGTGFSRSGDTVTASANPNTTGRSGTFTASYQGVSASASLYQEGNEDGEVIIQ
ncbi:fimbrillin family protein [Massilibacteroides vaginae]|uniref:fimbrillin family protein n=1 Tax=Massilibacteroides vaginae TaxID=1673718 RepID=UPI000A1CE8CE|nr:fimbrillin family protein [Massilibacteroides vaginae]